MAVSQRVQVTKAFRHKGEDVGAGSVLDLDLPTAQELRNAKKAEFVSKEATAHVLPLRKKERAPSVENQKIADLAAQVAALTALVEKQAAAKPSAKEKGNA